MAPHETEKRKSTSKPIRGISIPINAADAILQEANRAAEEDTSSSGSVTPTSSVGIITHDFVSVLAADAAVQSYLEHGLSELIDEAEMSVAITQVLSIMGPSGRIVEAMFYLEVAAWDADIATAHFTHDDSLRQEVPDCEDKMKKSYHALELQYIENRYAAAIRSMAANNAQDHKVLVNYGAITKDFNLVFDGRFLPGRMRANSPRTHGSIGGYINRKWIAHQQSLLSRESKQNFALQEIEREQAKTQEARDKARGDTEEEMNARKAAREVMKRKRDATREAKGKEAKESDQRLDETALAQPSRRELFQAALRKLREEMRRESVGDVQSGGGGEQADKPDIASKRTTSGDDGSIEEALVEDPENLSTTGKGE